MSDDISIPEPGYRMPRHRDAGWSDGTIRLATIAVGIVVGLGGAYAGLSYFHRHSGPVPVIQADDRPIRVKPENPGGMQIAGAGTEALAEAGDPKLTRLAAAPETPDVKPLQAPPPPNHLCACAGPKGGDKAAAQLSVHDSVNGRPAAARAVNIPLHYMLARYFL